MLLKKSKFNSHLEEQFFQILFFQHILQEPIAPLKKFAPHNRVGPNVWRNRFTRSSERIYQFILIM